MTTAVRARPVGAVRILQAYLAAFIGLGCGLPALIAGWVAASTCTTKGLGCLGWLIYGLFGMALIAAVVAVVAGVRYRLGLGWGLLSVVGVTAAVAFLPYPGSILPAGLAPGIFAWVTQQFGRRHTAT